MTKRKLKGTPKGKKGIKSNLPKDPKTGKVLPSPGRKPGIPNKITREAKEMIALAFEGLGGLQALIDTANKSDSMRMTFYTQLYAKLIPVSVQGQIDVDVAGDGQALAALERIIVGEILAQQAELGRQEPITIDVTRSDSPRSEDNNQPEPAGDSEPPPQLVLSSSTGTKAA